MAKKTKKVKGKVKRKHFYGMVKLGKANKLCWLSRENKNGWSLGLAYGARTLWLRNARFSTAKEVERACKSKIVFIHLKDLK